MRNFSSIVLAGALAVLAGCSFYIPASDSRVLNTDAPRLPPDAWPARQTEGLSEIVALTPHILTADRDRRVRLEDGTWEERGPVPVYEVVRSGVYGRGIVRELEPITDPRVQGDPGAAWQHPELIPRLQFVSFRPSAWPRKVDAKDETALDRRKSIMLRRLGVRPWRGDSAMAAMQGTRMQYIASGQGEVKGLVIHLTSLGGLDYERSAMNDLLERGFDVLRVSPSTARVEERPIDADAESDLSEAGARAAKIIDNRVAEIAFAVEGVVEFLEAEHPGRLTGKPIAVMGYSAGALAAPAVAAKLHDRVAAVVLVGGGANLLDISQRSTFTNGGITVEWRNGGGTPAAIDKLNGEYLKYSRLDPYNVAPCLGDRPVLILHALWDDIVQASDGDLLYDQLGHPERIVITMGHQGMFWRLPAYAGWVASWTEKAVGEFDLATAAVAAGKSPPSNVR